MDIQFPSILEKLNDGITDKWKVNLKEEHLKELFSIILPKYIKTLGIGSIISILGVFLVFFLTPHPAVVLLWCLLICTGIIIFAYGLTIPDRDSEIYLIDKFKAGELTIIPKRLRKKIKKKYDKTLDSKQLMYIYETYPTLGTEKIVDKLEYFFYFWALWFEMTIVSLFFLPKLYFDIVLILFGCSSAVFIPTVQLKIQTKKKKKAYIKSIIEEGKEDSSNSNDKVTQNLDDGESKAKEESD